MRDRVTVQLELHSVSTIESTIPVGTTIQEWRRQKAAARSRRRRLLRDLPARRAA